MQTCNQLLLTFPVIEKLEDTVFLHMLTVQQSMNQRTQAV